MELYVTDVTVHLATVQQLVPPYSKHASQNDASVFRRKDESLVHFANDTYIEQTLCNSVRVAI